MTGRLDPMVWVKQVLNMLIPLCIPLRSFFAWGKVNNQISYKYEVQGPDLQEKQDSGDRSTSDRRNTDNIEIHWQGWTDDFLLHHTVSKPCSVFTSRGPSR